MTKKGPPFSHTFSIVCVTKEAAKEFVTWLHSRDISCERSRATVTIDIYNVGYGNDILNSLTFSECTEWIDDREVYNTTADFVSAVNDWQDRGGVPK